MSGSIPGAPRYEYWIGRPAEYNPIAFHSVKHDAKVKKLAAACQKAGFGKLRPF